MANKSLSQASLPTSEGNAVNEAVAARTSSSRSTLWLKWPQRVRSVTRSTARLSTSARGSAEV